MDYQENHWVEGSRDCPACKSKLDEKGWWDDAPENGGACIGTLYQCDNCGYTDSE